jgi:hypothetical protein
VNHAACSDQSNIVANALQVGDAERDGILLGRYGTFQLIHHFVFKKDHGVVVTDGALEESLGIVGR